MRFTRVMPLLVAVLLFAAMARAQQASGEGSPEEASGYKVQVVISEYDGATKLGSLPYIIPVAVSSANRPATGSLRVGLRVPVATSTKSGESSIQYMDVGTMLDVRVVHAGAERYQLELTLERSSLYVREQTKDGKVEGRAWVLGDPSPGSAPVNQTLRANMEFLLRDGHSGETAAITDPVTGHVFKVDAMLTVLK
ncbi:MAG TPA: hypothetical protein VLW54_06375 [Candidatus Acidoferrales bacterium]|nr:hypothetical protein [Candidatus Acidoferrales bacterium]